jgi:hypothetical protein
MEDQDRDTARIVQYVKDNIKPGRYLYFLDEVVKLTGMPPDKALQELRPILQSCRLSGGAA